MSWLTWTGFSSHVTKPQCSPPIGIATMCQLRMKKEKDDKASVSNTSFYHDHVVCSSELWSSFLLCLWDDLVQGWHFLVVHSLRGSHWGGWKGTHCKWPERGRMTPCGFSSEPGLDMAPMEECCLNSLAPWYNTVWARGSSGWWRWRWCRRWKKHRQQN